VPGVRQFDVEPRWSTRVDHGHRPREARNVRQIELAGAVTTGLSRPPARATLREISRGAGTVVPCVSRLIQVRGSDRPANRREKRAGTTLRRRCARVRAERPAPVEPQETWLSRNTPMEAAMNDNQFLRDQFASLRHEIEGLQARLFWTVMIGMLGVPTMTYLTWDTDALVWIVMPFFTLVIIILFLAQHQQMMRAGRFIREQIEPRLPETPSWERWLESKPEYRLVDRHFFACFTLIFFVYYGVSMATSIERLWALAQQDESGLYWPFPLWCVCVVYHRDALGDLHARAPLAVVRRDG
jgi:hypothetical protein